MTGKSSNHLSIEKIRNDYHTLTIEILAKTAKVQRYEAASLKGAIEQDLRANVAVARQGGQVEKVGAYLRSVFSLSKLNEEEIWLLKQFWNWQQRRWQFLKGLCLEVILILKL
jgi:hypothetical protein